MQICCPTSLVCIYTVVYLVLLINEWSQASYRISPHPPPLHPATSGHKLQTIFFSPSERKNFIHYAVYKPSQFLPAASNKRLWQDYYIQQPLYPSPPSRSTGLTIPLSLSSGLNLPSSSLLPSHLLQQLLSVFLSFSVNNYSHYRF